MRDDNSNSSWLHQPPAAHALHCSRFGHTGGGATTHSVCGFGCVGYSCTHCCGCAAVLCALVAERDVEPNKQLFEEPRQRRVFALELRRSVCASERDASVSASLVSVSVKYTLYRSRGWQHW